MLHGERSRRLDRSLSWLVASWEGKCVYELGNGRVTELVSNIRGPAELGYDVKRNRVLVPLYLDDALLIRPGPGSIAAPPKPAAAGP